MGVIMPKQFITDIAAAMVLAGFVSVMTMWMMVIGG
jgi:hypothetical protein